MPRLPLRLRFSLRTLIALVTICALATPFLKSAYDSRQKALANRPIKEKLRQLLENEYHERRP